MENRAVSDQLYGHPNNYASVRAAVCRYIEEHRPDYEPFVEGTYCPSSCVVLPLYSLLSARYSLLIHYTFPSSATTSCEHFFYTYRRRSV
jgi:ABC-type cobalt transport system substrate-binding protein